ncbi:DUF1490 family protein [Kineococcus sp. R8]|uniref:DUF1490 family protein n=1 Tax=Kineococcus siccus TaxID=2696567 RepID=UPI001412F259|nr:DUF1490 family protein [Kineococcus siccus]
MFALAAPLGRLVVTAAASAGLVKAVSDGRGAAALRRVAVSGTKAGIRASRAAEAQVERSRLGAGDIVAQAYEELGERAPVRDVAAGGHDHQH